MDTGACIKKYVELRDYLAVIAEKHKAELAPYKSAMEAIENAIGAEMLQLGPDTQNIKTAFGTAMKVKWVSVKMADRQTFMGFIADDFWKRNAFLTAAVTKTEVLEYIETNHAPPPGLDITQGFDIQIRRAP